ncbi:Hypothetical protein AA314_05738 [Archangium gephyra]|uniref:Uncharacterized protein n=1 Tax=Archangium gephyra TaxID=48 RepID=A0AAC8TFG3_9BACT|nr:Hypothetical protein AA314_05738 [Archangium gephyra]
MGLGQPFSEEALTIFPHRDGWLSGGHASHRRSRNERVDGRSHVFC